MTAKAKKRKTMILFLPILLLIVLSGIYYILTNNTEIQEEKMVASQLNLDSITGVAYEYNNKKVEFKKEGDLWVLNSDANFPLNQKQIKSMVYATTIVNAERVVDSNSQDDARFGLDNPEITIWITDLNGRTVTYLLNSYKKDQNQYYFSVLGTDTVYLIEATLFNWFSKDLNELAELDEFPSIAKEDVAGLTISLKESTIEINYIDHSSGLTDSDESHWFVKNKAGGYWAIDKAKTERLLAGITSLVPVSCAEYKVTEEELALYGLDSPHGTVFLQSDNPYTIYIGNKAKNDSNYYIMHSESPMVFLVKSTKIDEILGTSYDSLISEQICRINPKTVEKLKVILNGKTDEIDIDWSGDGVKGKLNGKRAEEETFLAFLESITNLKRDGLADEDIDYNNSKPYLSIVFKGAGFPETALDIYEYDINFYRVEFGGNDCLLVGSRDVKNILEKRKELHMTTEI